MRLIDADALKKTTAFINGAMYKVVTAKDIENAPTVDAVSKEVFARIKWERDIAIGELKAEQKKE